MKCVTGRGCSCQGRSGVGSPPSTVWATRYRQTSDIEALAETVDVPTGTTSVALKLNLCEYRLGDSGATTSVGFVEDVVTALRHRCPRLSRVVFVEADSSGTRAHDLFALLGFADLATRLDCELFDPASGPWRLVDHIGELPVEVPEAVFAVDLFVNLPKLKFHGKTAYTGALKNNFGLLRRRWKLPYHDRLCETIVASNLHLPRQLAITDGSITLSGRGPSYGRPTATQVALGSWDPVAIDAAGARLLGLPAWAAGHIGMARAAGLGSDHPQLTWISPETGLAERPRFDWLRFAAVSALRRA